MKKQIYNRPNTELVLFMGNLGICTDPMQNNQTGSGKWM